MLDLLERTHGGFILSQPVLSRSEHEHIIPQRLLFVLRSRFPVDSQVLHRAVVVLLEKTHLTQYAVQLAVIQVLRMLAKQRGGSRLRLFVITRRVVYLRQVIRDGLGVLRVVLQRLQGRKRLLIPLQLVHTVGVVIGAAGRITAVPLAQLAEIDRGTLVFLHHQIGVSAVKRIVCLMIAAQGLRIYRLQYLQPLFVMPFLYL